LNNIILSALKKAAILVCLFLWSYNAGATTVTDRPVAIVAEDQWKFDDVTKRAYDLVLNLQVEQDHMPF